MSGGPDTSHDVMQLPSWDEYDELENSQDAPTDDPTHSGAFSSYSFSVEEPGGSGMNVSSPLPRVEEGDSQQPVPISIAPTLPAGFFIVDHRLHSEDPEDANYPEDPNIPSRNVEISDHGLPQLVIPGTEEPLTASTATSNKDDAPSLPDEELRLVRRRGFNENQLPPPEPNQVRHIPSSSQPDLTLPDATNENEDHFGPLPPSDLHIPTGSQADDIVPASPSQTNSHPLEMPFDDEESVNNEDVVAPAMPTTNLTIENAILGFHEPVSPSSSRSTISNNVSHTNGATEHVPEPNNYRKRKAEIGEGSRDAAKVQIRHNDLRPQITNNCRSPANEDLGSHPTVHTSVDK